jgi:hypothetical protein
VELAQDQPESAILDHIMPNASGVRRSRFGVGGAEGLGNGPGAGLLARP